jgi:hypothetical protein
MSYYDPPAGPQMPNKYPTAVGNNYRKYGEQQGKIYDPYTDKYYNPNPNSPERKKYFQDMGQIAKDPKEASLADQVIPAAATMGAIYGAKTLGEQAPGFIGDKLGGLFSGSGSAASTTAPTVATAGANTAPALATPEILSAGRSAADAGLAADAANAGSAWTNTSTASNVGGALATAKGAYDTQRGWEHGGEGLRSGTTTLGAGIGTLVGGPLGTAAGAAIGNTIGYGLQGSGWKNDAALLAATGLMASPLIIARRLGFNPIHKTTKQVQQEHSQQLSELDPNNAAWQNYIGGMRNQVTNKEAPYAGKYKTFDEYKKAGLQANDLTGVYGNLKTFGPDWSKMSFADKQKVTQALIDANMYKSKKGEVVVTDEEKAKQIRDQVLGIKPPPKVATKVTPKPLIDTKVTNKALGGLLAKK